MTAPFMSRLWLAVRSVAWAVLVPTMVTVYVPWRFFGVRDVRLDLAHPGHILGLAMAAVGVAVLGWCIWAFAVSGRGTLSPLDPPRRLVVRGLYRYVRNPMYVGGTLLLLGQVLLARSLSLLAYWAIWFTLVNLMVLFYEEPTLRRMFGAEYEAYVREVGRWVPRRGR